MAARDPGRRTLLRSGEAPLGDGGAAAEAPPEPSPASPEAALSRILSPGAALLPPGREVGRYRILRVLARGGMGVVYEALHLDIERRVAIKVLDAELVTVPGAAARFLNEARAPGRVRHPGLVEVFEFGQLPEGPPYIVMELLEGELLSERLLRRTRLDAAEARDVARRIARALQAVHERGIVHRDLKPDNLMLVPDPERPGETRVKILDFGIAKLRQSLPPGGRPTEAGTTIGTAEYMAPEQCMGVADLDGRADVYALGVLLYEMLSGRPPFRAAMLFDVLTMHVRAKVPPLAAAAPEAPAELAALVHRMLEKDPAARPAIGEVVATLEALPLGPPAGGAERRGEGPRSVGEGPRGAGEGARATQPVARSGGAVSSLSLPGTARAWRPGGVRAAVVALGLSGGLLVALGPDLLRLLRPAPGPEGALRATAGPPGALQATAGPPGALQATAARSSPARAVPPTAAPAAAAPDRDEARGADGPRRAAAPVRWSVDSEPSGAAVLRALDGVVLGATPWRGEGAPGGPPLSIILRKPGFLDRPLVLGPSDRSERLRLEPLPAPQGGRSAKERGRPGKPRQEGRRHDVDLFLD